MQRASLPHGGAGLVVCEPVPVNADAATATLGTGCAMWLQFYSAGQPEMGRTPLWEDIVRARREMRRPDMRLVLEQLSPLERATGASHAVVGDIRGGGASISLNLRLVQFAGRATIGPVMAAHGTAAQIAAALPGIGRELDSRLGIAHPRLPAAPAPDELILLGRLGWAPAPPLKPADYRQLADVAGNDPLAAMIAIPVTPTPDQAAFPRLASTLLARCNGAATAYGSLAMTLPQAVVRYRADIEAAAAAHPSNYQIAVSKVMLLRAERSPAEATASAGLCALAPGCPSAWLAAARHYMDHADSLRRARVAADIPPSEWTVLTRDYAEWVRLTRRSVEIDPLLARGWQRLAAAATFAGDMELADRAEWKAIALDPTNRETYTWGMEMYQPKWGGDPAKLRKVATLAVAAFNYDSGSTYIIQGLRDGGQQAEADRLRDLVLTKQAERVAQHPNDPDAHWNHAWELHYAGRYSEAVREFQAALALNPAVRYRDGLGQSLVRMGRFAEAADELGKYTAAFPNDVQALQAEGLALGQSGQTDKAVSVLRRCIAIQPDQVWTYGGLGDILFGAGRFTEALPEYEKAVKMSPRWGQAWCAYSLTLSALNRGDDAVAAAMHATEILPDDPAARSALAFAYLRSGKPDLAEREARAAVTAHPSSLQAHEALAETFLAENRKDQARKEWQLIIDREPDGPAARRARELLSKNP